MAQITFEIEDSVAQALAVGRGWKPMVEDVTQPLQGDSYPLRVNEVTYQQYASNVAAEFMTQYVLLEGRKQVLTQFDSIHASVAHKINSGAFDPLILTGDIEAIKTSVKASL